MIKDVKNKYIITTWGEDIKLAYGYIYVFKNKINGKCYVGQTINPEARYKSHINAVNRGEDRYFYRAIRKYGIENFDYKILYGDLFPIETIQHSLNELERYFIKVFDSYNNGYNMTTGGEQDEAGFQKKQSEETKKKISRSLMGHEGANKGKKLSLEARHNMSVASLGKKGTITGRKLFIDENGRRHYIKV